MYIFINISDINILTVISEMAVQAGNMWKIFLF